ncbi:hypothetical protein TSAR_015403 [Trichomalopsis sarcophagae]|uniref:Uncharacterized protein n=1 Tax=Trichomalopsis sarcophagae TaxID=543379 RepID=A0A232EGY0_9HYME|nr:hypothetical protein TSAR_015403 [Trichomalopsis sarcophagae]
MFHIHVHYAQLRCISEKIAQKFEEPWQLSCRQWFSAFG